MKQLYHCFFEKGIRPSYKKTGYMGYQIYLTTNDTIDDGDVYIVFSNRFTGTHYTLKFVENEDAMLASLSQLAISHSNDLVFVNFNFIDDVITGLFKDAAELNTSIVTLMKYRVMNSRYNNLEHQYHYVPYLRRSTCASLLNTKQLESFEGELHNLICDYKLDGTQETYLSLSVSDRKSYKQKVDELLDKYTLQVLQSYGWKSEISNEEMLPVPPRESLDEFVINITIKPSNNNPSSVVQLCEYLSLIFKYLGYDISTSQFMTFSAQIRNSDKFSFRVAQMNTQAVMNYQLILHDKLLQLYNEDKIGRSIITILSAKDISSASQSLDEDEENDAVSEEELDSTTTPIEDSQATTNNDIEDLSWS